MRSTKVLPLLKDSQVTEVACIEFGGRATRLSAYQMVVSFRAGVRTPFSAYIQKENPQSTGDHNMVDLIKCFKPVC